ncbi:capsular biosynthesis protein [Ralstonia pickettii]|uniref:capsular biosynthesis protein n=1 Tax=Ralstonia pickettii TaxID=329 RepID=UPI0027154871|nr:capsular biosynthesis protein [Ralstonia pickettii]WKZ85934.1 capsular biosynthesis protein [Ralstonia pickettii]
MISKERCLVLDIDGTIVPTKGSSERYEDLIPFPDVVAKIREYREMGFYIILYSSRNMKTYEGNVGLINANTAKVLLNWLEKHQIPHDELHLGKPWVGHGGFYVDDKAIRPDEFLKHSYEEVLEIISPGENGQ